MRTLRRERSDLEFFLSTDSPEVSEAVHRRFDRVHELPDKGGHNSRAGVQDGLCDLYLLASTHYILGSHWSSFSETAAMLGGNDAYETARKVPAVSLREALARPTSLPHTGLVEQRAEA